MNEWGHIHMKSGLHHSSNCVYNVNYHIVWSTKYRKRVLYPAVARQMRIWAAKIGQLHDFTVRQFEIGNMDHVHCFVSCTPQKCVSEIVRTLKGTLGRYAFQKYPYLRKRYPKRHLWNPSYYVETIGCISEGTIRRYIQTKYHASKK